VVDITHSQMWSAGALFVTEAIANVLGLFLQDEFMFAPTPDGENPWRPQNDGFDEKTWPTLACWAEDGFAALRGMQRTVVEILDLRCGLVGASLLVRSFPALPEASIHEAMQHLVLETTADLYMRFSCYYTRFPAQLARLACDSTPEDEKVLIAERFATLPDCCARPHFEKTLKLMFPTVGELLGDAAKSLLRGWATSQRW